MARTRTIDPKLVAKAKVVANQTRDIHIFKAAQAVLLPAVLNATLEQTAVLIGVSRMSVHRFQRQFARFNKGSNPELPRKHWGGRRRSLLSLEEEKEFLTPWIQKAREAGMIVVSPLRAALAQRVGMPVAASVVYRLLGRHGWRKVAPDTRHPKNDYQVMKQWKKNFRNGWAPCCENRRSAAEKSG